jgi:tetratricopeptide (TPR) repeat protein
VLLLICVKLYNQPLFFSTTPLLIPYQALLSLDLAALLFGSVMVAECLRIIFYRQTYAWLPRAHIFVILGLFAIYALFSYFIIFPKKSSYYHNIAWEFVEQKDYARASQSLDIAIAYDPGNISAYLERGFVQREVGAFSLALKDYAHVTSIDPENAGSYEGMGYVYYSMGDNTNALLSWRKALSIDAALSAKLDKWIKAAEKSTANKAL